MLNHFDISLLMLKLTMENTRGPLQPSSRDVGWEMIRLRFWDSCLLCFSIIFLLFSISYHRPPEDQVLGFKLQVGDLADQGSSRPAEDPYCVNGWVRSDQNDKMVKLWEDQLFSPRSGAQNCEKMFTSDPNIDLGGKSASGHRTKMQREGKAHCRALRRSLTGLCVAS